MQKKYLITGGAGMIGSNLVRELVDMGIQSLLWIIFGGENWNT